MNSFEGNYEILRTIFQPRALSSDIPASRKGVYLFYNAPNNGWCKLESTLLLPIFSPLSCTLGPLTVKRVGNPVYLFENHWSQGVQCFFEGRPRPQITWYKKYSNLKTFNQTEVETLQDNGIFKVTTTLHVPGRKEFEGIYSCFGNNSLSSGWSSSKEPEYGIELLFRCKQSLSSSAVNNWQFKKRRQQRKPLGQRHKSLTTKRFIYLTKLLNDESTTVLRAKYITVCQTRL